MTFTLKNKSNLFVRRNLAGFIDLLLPLLAVLVFLDPLLTNFRLDLSAYLISYVLVVFMNVVMECFFGRTLGKWLFNLKVVPLKGVGLILPQVIFRNMLKLLLIFTVIPFFGFISIFAYDDPSASWWAPIPAFFMLPFVIFSGFGGVGIFVFIPIVFYYYSWISKGSRLEDGLVETKVVLKSS